MTLSVVGNDRVRSRYRISSIGQTVFETVLAVRATVQVVTALKVDTVINTITVLGITIFGGPYSFGRDEKREDADHDG